jgi:LemA protein
VSSVAIAASFAIVLLVVIVGFLALATYNSVVILHQQVSKAWANIDVVLKQRHDELPNLVEAVRDLMAYEQATLTRVTRLRAAYSAAAPVPDQARTSDATSAAIRQLFAVVERYPEIRSQSNVLDLQREIERLEDLIAARRELYNDTVYRFNSRIRQFPTNVLAWTMGWTERPFFAASADERLTPAADVTPDQTDPTDRGGAPS